MTSAVRKQASPGLYELDERGRPLIVTSCCPICGSRSFPSRSSCDTCLGGATVLQRLGPYGAIHAFTVVHETFGLGSWPPPYGVAKVDLGKGFRVRGLLDPDSAGWQVGQRVETIEVTLDLTPEIELLTYAFRPMGH
jgi:uncharacterized OB-fold protein